MDYFCLERHDNSYQRFVDYKKSFIEKKYKEFVNLKEEVKHCHQIDKDTTLYVSISIEEPSAQSYIITPFNSLDFRNYINSYLEKVPIDRIKNTAEECLNLPKSNIRDLNLNSGSRTGFTQNREKVHYHEWCSVINKLNYEESLSYLSADYFVKDDFTHFTGDIKISFENRLLITIYFIDDLNENYSKFRYSISNIGCNSKYISYESEIKYRSRENSIDDFFWKKGKHELRDLGMVFKEEFSIFKNNPNGLEEKEGMKMKKIIHDDHTEIINTDWSKKEKQDYEKIVTSKYFNVDNRHIQEILINYVDETKRTFEQHFSNNKDSIFEKRGMTKHESFKENSSNGTYYLQNNHKQIHEHWYRFGDEVKSSRTEQTNSHKKQKVSGYRIINNVKTYEFEDNYIHDLERKSEYCNKTGWSSSDGNKWRSSWFSNPEEQGGENWGENTIENKEWYEKWTDSRYGK